MMRNLKHMGVALAAVFAISAIAAAPASANQFHFGSTTLTVASAATQAFKYETSGKITECTTVGGSGEITPQTASEVTISPTYSKCTVNGIGGSQAEVIMNGCDYLFTIEAAENSGPVHVKCPESKQIAITVKVIGISLCTYHIPEQTPTGKADYANSGVTKLNVQPTQTGISASREGSAECGPTTSATGSYTGQVQVKAEFTGQQTETNVQVG